MDNVFLVSAQEVVKDGMEWKYGSVFLSWKSFQAQTDLVNYIHKGQQKGLSAFKSLQLSTM